MKRDLDLIRNILLYVEEAPNYNPHLIFNELPEQFRGIDDFIFREHALLMEEHNLLECTNTSGGIMDMRLTWSGHEFLDNSREPEIWNAAKESAGHLSFGVFGSVLNHLAISHGLGLLKSGFDAALSRLGAL